MWKSNSTGYYDETAFKYDVLHGANEPEHTVAMEIGWPLFGSVSSVLDVGSGTGRSLQWIFSKCGANVDLFGIEPSDGLLEIAKQKLPAARFQKGFGEALPFDNQSIDVVIATGIMHHADDTRTIIAEMFRVARLGVLISDHNNFAFGGSMARRIRMMLRLCGMLKSATYVKQGFKKRGYSENDGWWYPYSLLDDYERIVSLSSQTYIIPTRKSDPGLGNFIFSQSHLAIVALKECGIVNTKVLHMPRID